MDDLFWLIVLITIFGTFISWLGRTVVALLISYFVVGVVGSVIAYFGFEVFNLASYGNTYAERDQVQKLLFLLEFINLRKIAIFFIGFSEEERKLIIGAITGALVIAITLPFVTFSNAIYAAMGADAGTKSIGNLSAFLRPKIGNIESADTEIKRELHSITDTIDTLSSEITHLRREVESNKTIQPAADRSAD